MTKSQEIKKINMIIKRRSDKYYKNNPGLCAKHNLYARCEVFIKYKKRVWPPLKPSEIREFITVTGYPAKYLKDKNGKRKSF